MEAVHQSADLNGQRYGDSFVFMKKGYSVKAYSLSGIARVQVCHFDIRIVKPLFIPITNFAIEIISVGVHLFNS